MFWQMLLLFGVALFVSGQLNRAIYGWAYFPRPISPWGPLPLGRATPRPWWVRVPIVGWWGMRREQADLGTGFWIRPALVELSFSLGMVLLFYFESQGGLLPIGAKSEDHGVVWPRFLTHAILCSLMTIATFIDWDEQTIPDIITLPGILVGLVAATAWPQSRLPTWSSGQMPWLVTPLHLLSPHDWDVAWFGPRGLMVVLICVMGWWLAFQPKTLWYRGGLIKFLRFAWVSMWRDRRTPWWLLFSTATALLTAWVWRGGGSRWEALASAWIGVAVGGGTVWLVRIVASVALHQEAMGFGDVTLMGMIGAFVGWQPAVMIFFLAPFTGIVLAVGQWLFTGRKDIPFGPFLCLSTVVMLVAWPLFWDRFGRPIFGLGFVLILCVVVCLVMLGGLLWMWRLVRGDRDGETRQFVGR